MRRDEETIRLAMLAVCLFGVPSLASAQEAAQITARVHELLDAYGKKDVARVMGNFDVRSALMMGADVREVAATRAAVGRLRQALDTVPTIGQSAAELREK